tara:strand:- start:1245 stop:2063 length:819 start_codon:yes stop_codon:yes gene_type:complete
MDKKRSLKSYASIFISISSLVISIVYVGFFFMLKSNTLVLITLPFSVFFLFATYGSVKNYINLSKRVLVVTMYAAVLIVGTCLRFEAGIYLWLFYILTLSSVMIEPKKIYIQGLLLILSIGIYFFMQQPHELLRSQFEINQSLTNIQALFNLSMIGSLSYTFSVLYLIRKKYQDDKEMKQSLLKMNAEISMLQKIMVTLRHEINNYLVPIISGTSLMKKANKKEDIVSISNAIKDSGEKINEVLKKISLIKSPAEKDYAEGVLMLDIEGSKS